MRMMKNVKRIASTALAASLCLACLFGSSMTASAVVTKEQVDNSMYGVMDKNEDFEYGVCGHPETGYYSYVMLYIGTGKDVVLPTEFDGFPVDGRFDGSGSKYSGEGASDIYSLCIPAEYSEIYGRCLDGQDRLTDITILNDNMEFVSGSFWEEPVTALVALKAVYDENGNRIVENGRIVSERMEQNYIIVANPGSTAEAYAAREGVVFCPLEKKGVLDFAKRMYTVALGRDAEPKGLSDWVGRLLGQEIDGAGIAEGFIGSAEFANKNLSDEAYVDVLYHTFFDRDPDEDGRADWLSKLAAGASREYVLAGFVNSDEFDALCARYGILRGTMTATGAPAEKPASGSSASGSTRDFVERLYNVALGRESDEAGIADWVNRISTGDMSAEDVAKSFFFSEEYTNKNAGNEEFVSTLYLTFMGREADEAGKADWVGRLNGGTSREEVLEGFSRSEEFGEILKSFGL